MHQQFLNTPMDNCDPQMYLGQGRFSNLSHQLKAHTTTAAVTLTDLEEATRLRMFQPGFCPAPHVSSNNSCIQRRQPVDTSGLKCPIVMMNNPFQRQTDRDRTAGAVDVAGDPARETSYCQQDPAKDMSYCQQDPARDTSYSQQGPARDMSYCQQDPARETSYCQQNIELDRSFFGHSDQVPAYTYHHHHVQEMKTVPGSNQASQASKHRTSQYHPGSSSANQPQIMLCAGTHGCDNDTQITEGENLNVPTHTHLEGQHVQRQTGAATHFSPVVGFLCGQESGLAGTVYGTYNNSQPPHNQSQCSHKHNNNHPPHNNNQPPHNYSQPSYNYSQLPHTYNQLPHNQSQPQHNYNQLPHNYNQPSHNYSQLIHHQNQPPHNDKHPNNQRYPQNSYSQPHHMDSVLYNNYIPQVEQHPRMTGDGAATVPRFLTSNSVNDLQTHRGLTSQPMFAEVTSSYYRQHPHITRGQHPHTRGGHHPDRTLGHCPTNRPACERINMSEASPEAGAYHCRHLMPGVRRGYRHNTNIRAGERLDIQNHLVPGRVLQVHGAPMTGKSTLVRQAVSDAIFNSAPSAHLCDHHISCKGVTSFQDFLCLVAQSWSPQPLHGRQPDTDSVLNMIGSFLQQSPHSHHILVFHKCENLRASPHGQQFLEFLAEIVNEFASLSVSIVFTTYKHYWTPPSMSIGEVEVDVLSVIDIIQLLQYYVPHIDDFVSYANVLAKTFCFPEAVRLIAEEYLVVKNCHVTPEKLEKIINKNQDLLSQLFENRLQEVDSWVSKHDLRFLTHFMHSIENSFTEAHLEYVNSSDLDQVHLQKMISYLKKNHLVRSLPGIRRLVIHPLIVYHSIVSSDRDRQLLPERWLDNTRNRYIHFLGRVLMSIEANMHAHGRKGLVFAGLIQEWPNVQYVFQMALHCNRNTYGNFVKVAITASNYILKIFPREAESFYWSLYNSAKDYGTPVEFAVMEAFLGQAIAEGTGISEGKDWGRAIQYLSSAIEHLSRFGNSYFLGWAIIRKAIIHHRQGKYQESIEYFQQASRVLNNVNRWALGEEFLVPEPKIDEEMITQRIHMTIPIIFTGRNREARRLLDAILDLIQNCFENHPDIATLLNLIGLTEQRGNRDTQRALMWYKLSYNERMYWAKACPESLLAVLNNIGMIYFYQGDSEECMKYLEKALAIRRECGWTHYNTGLTLVHVAEINMKVGHLVEAFKLLLEAERIFAATVKDHDMRLRVNFDLAHIRVLIRQALEPRDAAREFSRRMQSQESYGQDERPAEGSSSQERDVEAEGITTDACSRTGQRKTSWDTSGDSVTSSQLLEAGSASQQFTNATHHHHHHRQHSENSSLPFPASEDTLRISAADIEPCDLRMSASDYFERILAVASTIQGTLSDDGLSIVLCSHEHLMLLNLGNAPEKFEEHRTAIASFSADNPWLDVDGDTDTGVDSTYRCLIKHKPLYSYVQRTPYESLDIPTFIQHMMKACLTCRFIDDACRVETWKTEAVNCIQNRENRKRWTEESDRVRSSTQSGRTGNDITSSAAVSKEAEGSTYMLPRFNQNCVSSMFNAQNVSFTRSETRALPDFKELLSSENLVDDGDRVVGVQYPIAIGQGEGHRQTPNQFLNQSSLVSPIIARTQEEILKTIQSMRNSCLLAAGMEAEKSLPGDSGVCRKNYHDRRSTAVPDVLTCREPVEQSYHCELEPNRFGDGNLQQRGTIVSRQTLASTDIHNYRAQPFKESQTEIEKLGHRKNRNSQWSSPRRPISEGIECKSRQVLADADRGNVVPDRVSDEVLPDELNKSQLVLELCRSDQTSQSDLTSGKIVDLCISMSEQTSGQNSPGNKISKAQNDTFSVLEYIRNSFNTDMYTSTEPAATASSSQQEETQQLPCEDIQVAGVQGEKANGRHAGSKVSSSRPGLGNRTLPSASPSSQPFDAALYLENYLHLLTASASKHEQQSMTERQPQSLQPRPHLQCLGGTDLPDGSRDSGRVSALVHNMNNSECANRPTSNCGSSAFSRSRVMSSSSLLSSGHHAFSHGTSASESGYSSEQQLTCLTGMLKARPVEGALSSPRYHQKHVSDPCINHAFSDHFPSSDGLLTEAGRTDTDTKMSGRECSPTERMLAMLTYIQTLAQMPSFPDQSVFSQADVQLPQAEDSQTDNQVPDIRASLLPENSNSLIFREAVEQSWNETLMPDFTQFSAEVGDMSASGMIRPELLLVENQIRQREYDSSPDSEEVTLAENMRSLQS